MASAAWGGATTFIAGSSQVLGAPGAQALVQDEVVVHRGLAIIPEVQHARPIVQEAAGIGEELVEAEEARAVRRQVYRGVDSVGLVVFERHLGAVRDAIEVGNGEADAVVGVVLDVRDGPVAANGGNAYAVFLVRGGQSVR